MSEGKTPGRLAYEELSRRVGSEYDSWDKLPGDLRAAHEASVVAGAASAHERTAELVSEVNELRKERDEARKLLGEIKAVVLWDGTHQHKIRRVLELLGVFAAQPAAVVTSGTEHLAELIGGLAIPDGDGAA